MDALIDDVSVKMELDTGAAISVMSSEDFKRYFPGKALHKFNLNLKTYTGEKVKALGTLPVTVKMNGQTEKLELVIVAKGGPPLFGRNWLRALRLNWREIAQFEPVNETTKKPCEKVINQLLDKYQKVFEPGIGKLRGITAKFTVEKDAVPKFCKPRTVPYALRPKVEAELDRLESETILSKIDHSEWATPVVPVPKASGAVRICGDFKVTVNSSDTTPPP